MHAQQLIRKDRLQVLAKVIRFSENETAERVAKLPQNAIPQFELEIQSYMDEPSIEKRWYLQGFMRVLRD